VEVMRGEQGRKGREDSPPPLHKSLFFFIGLKSPNLEELKK